MCGILGFTGKRNKKELSRLLSIIQHRGFDGQSIFIQNDVHFGMNRLAIIDLTKNLYPMKYKKLTLVFNGEIYNFKDLKNMLQQKGIHFKTNSDAEIILPLYDLYGNKAFSMLEGMFAISIYNNKSKKILLIRDKSGEKPLYYVKSGDNFFFSSEIKVLLQIPGIAKQLNRPRLSEYFTHGFVHAPNTLIQSIKKLPPATVLTFNVQTQSLVTKKYWDVSSFNNTAISINVRSSRSILDKLLSDSVMLRLISDVPIGCFLSGGIDSSLICQYAVLVNPMLRTYSATFPGYENQDESIFSSYVAKMLKTNHTQVECTSTAVIEVLENLGTLIDEPIVDPAFVPTFLLAREARKKVKVVLTGEGADELFAGYSRYTVETQKEKLHNAIISSKLTQYIWKQVFGNTRRRILLPIDKRYSPQHVWDMHELCLAEKYTKEPGLMNERYYSPKKSTLFYLQTNDFARYLSDQLLNKVDKATMAANLEARAPYLDSRIIEYAFSIPDNQKHNFLQGKLALKKVAEKYFPKKYVWRKKHGFEMPLSEWFKKDLKMYAYDSLSAAAKYPTIFEYARYKRIIDDHMNGSKNNANKIWSMIVLTRWLLRNEIVV